MVSKLLKSMVNWLDDLAMWIHLFMLCKLSAFVWRSKGVWFLIGWIHKMKFPSPIWCFFPSKRISFHICHLQSHWLTFVCSLFRFRICLPPKLLLTHLTDGSDRIKISITQQLFISLHWFFRSLSSSLSFEIILNFFFLNSIGFCAITSI